MKKRRFGLIFGGILAVAAVAGGAFLLMKDKPVDTNLVQDIVEDARIVDTDNIDVDALIVNVD